VRFDEALHEFTFLPGVKEDVSDIILNLKDLVLRSESDTPVTMRIDVRGPADVTGADLRTTSDVEVLNSGVHIATVNAKGRLAIDVTVEQGKGYAPAERKQAASTIGVIPVDAIFSPVRRVAFVVEPTRVEVSTDFDRIVMDIETDGSISPREALASAGQTLRGLLSIVAQLAGEGRGLELGEVGIAVTGSPDLDLPIEDLDLPERPRNCLKRAQINTVGELGGPAGDHQLRPEVARRGTRAPRRAWLVAARGRGLRCPQPRRRGAASAETRRTRRPCWATSSPRSSRQTRDGSSRPRPRRRQCGPWRRS
jgi:DNA-directed RNA polymerase subunit alpha